MTILKRLFSQLLLACWMLAGAGQAWAGPIYQVAIDTATLGSGTAWLGLSFLSLDGASPASARVVGLAGDLQGDATLSGSVASTADGYLFSNAGGGGELVQALQLGGIVSFVVRFDADPGPLGSTFGFALFDDTRYLGADGDLGYFELTSDALSGLQVLPVIVAGQVASVVPEPSGVALLLVAAAAMAFCARRRARR